MSYGFTAWDAEGNVQMTTDDFTYQVMHNQVYDLRVTAPLSISVPGFDPAKCSAVILPLDAISETEMGFATNALPYTSLASGLITIRRQTPAGTVNAGSSLLRFRLLVMRHSN